MAYKIEFETGTAIPTLQNTFDSGIREGCGVGRGGGGDRIKSGRNRVYLKAAADNKKMIVTQFPRKTKKNCRLLFEAQKI